MLGHIQVLEVFHHLVKVGKSGQSSLHYMMDTFTVKVFSATKLRRLTIFSYTKRKRSANKYAKFNRNNKRFIKKYDYYVSIIL